MGFRWVGRIVGRIVGRWVGRYVPVNYKQTSK